MTRRRMFATALFLSTASLVKGSGVGLVADRTTPDIRALYQDTDVGVFGRGPGDWEAYDYIEKGTTSGGYTIFERQDESGFIYYVGFDGNVTVLAQLVVLDGNVDFSEMESFAMGNWLPSDAQFVDEFEGVLVDPDSLQMRAQLWYSDALFNQNISRSGNILVSYGSSGGSGFDRVSVSIGT
jgi:hypothetical protein